MCLHGNFVVNKERTYSSHIMALLFGEIKDETNKFIHKSFRLRETPSNFNLLVLLSFKQRYLGNIICSVDSSKYNRGGKHVDRSTAKVLKVAREANV